MLLMQRLENGYLAILRFVAVVAATILLVAAGVFGLGSLGYFRAEPKPVQIQPKVDAQSAISSALERTAESDANKPVSEKRRKESGEDAVAASLRKTVEKIVTFVQKASNGQMNLNQQEVMNFLRNESNKFSGDLRQQWIDGLGPFLDAAFASPKVLAKASAAPEPFSRNAPSVEIVVALVHQFTQEFERQVDATSAGNKAAYDEYIQKKADGLQNFYEAGIAFVTFLSVVFLFIIIKIERNLRAMVPKEQATEVA